jgi:SCP-2 sterol transfer family
VTNDAKEEAVWTIDMKNTGTVYKGPPTKKADVTILLSDDVLTQLAEGKVRISELHILFLSDLIAVCRIAQWPESVYDWKIKDERKRHARNQARWSATGEQRTRFH